MNFNSIFGISPKVFYNNVLLNPFEEDLNILRCPLTLIRESSTTPLVSSGIFNCAKVLNFMFSFGRDTHMLQLYEIEKEL
jgi:hypothetical protein